MRRTPSGRRRKGRRILLIALLGIVGVGIWHFFDQIRDIGVNDRKYSEEIVRIATRYDLDPQLVRAVVFQESRFRAGVRGAAGEIGLMQLMPGAVTDYARAARKAVPRDFELYRPEVNLEIGCWYLAQAVRKYRYYKYGTELALCQYNAGASRSDAWKPKNPDGEVMSRITIRSTRQYVRQIMQRYRRYTLEGRAYPSPTTRKVQAK